MNPRVQGGPYILIGGDRLMHFWGHVPPTPYTYSSYAHASNAYVSNASVSNRIFFFADSSFYFFKLTVCLYKFIIILKEMAELS